MHNLSLDVDDMSEASIDLFVKDFVFNNKEYINKYGQKAYGSDKLSLFAFQELVAQEVKKGCYSFVKNNHSNEYLEQYLLSIISRVYKKIHFEYKKTVYICPGCKYSNNIEVLNHISQNLTCNRCLNSDKKCPWDELLINAFASHARSGHRCPDCKNYIPSTGTQNIVCPYPNCLFVGNVNKLRWMKHPYIKSTLELASHYNFKDVESSTDTCSFVNNEVNNYINIIQECILKQIEGLKFKCYNSTYMNKLCMYKAFYNLVGQHPLDMVSYLIYLNKNVNIQNRIFQEFVNLLESNIPYSYNKNEKTYEVKSLLDENLGLFNGITEYNAIVDNDREIPNDINELYVGGRKGKYCRSYYIGKVIDVIDLNTNKSLINNVKEYSFVKINMDNNILPGTKVNVNVISHAPHYGIGVMLYLNRTRRELVDKIYFILNGKNRKVGGHQ
jgi:hypothetical protein